MADRSEFDGLTELVGYPQASRYIGVKRNTLSSYVTRGIGPPVKETRVVDQYVQPVFDRAEMDAWMARRPGQGSRTDLEDVAA